MMRATGPEGLRSDAPEMVIVTVAAARESLRRAFFDREDQSPI